MSGAFHVDALRVAEALKKTVDLTRENLGDQAADAVAANLSRQLQVVSPDFAWLGAAEELRPGGPSSAWEKRYECEPPNTEEV